LAIFKGILKRDLIDFEIVFPLQLRFLFYYQVKAWTSNFWQYFKRISKRDLIDFEIVFC